MSTSSMQPPPVPVGPELAAVLAVVDGSRTGDHELLEAIADADRLVAWAHARQAELLADFARRPVRVDKASEDLAVASAGWARPGRWVREFADDEVAARLRISRQDAAGRIRLGCALEELPATKASLTAGRIDQRRARVMAEETQDLDRSTRRGVDAALIEAAERLPAARLRPRVRQAVLDVDGVAAHARAERARSDRKVVILPAEDGMADLWARLPATDAITIKEAITATARASKSNGSPDDARTMDQRMADALTAPFAAALRTGELAGVRLAERRGQRAELHVTVAASTLLGLDEAPAVLRGYGPITAQAARELAPDARMRRILTDPASGAVLDVGTTVYKPPAALYRFVEVRDQYCTYPGCGYPAVVADFDHTVPYPEGSTSASNGGMRCRRHHRFKQSRGVRIEQDEAGVVRWRMPTGHEYEVRPPAVGPIVLTEPPEPPEPPESLEPPEGSGSDPPF